MRCISGNQACSPSRDGNFKERFIIRRRYLVAETQTLRELGLELGISRERVRQLEVRAKDKLRQVLSAKPWIAELLEGSELEQAMVA